MLGNISLKYFSKRIWISSIALLFCIFPLIGQEASNISIQYANYNTDDGLPTLLTNSTFQDSRGFFWVANYYGFSRFDGKEFVNYSPVDWGLSFGAITDIHEDEEGNLWLSEMSHESSLLKKRFLIFNPNTEEIEFYKKDSSHTFFSITNAPENKILVGTAEGKLLKCNTQNYEQVFSFSDERPIKEIVATPHYYWLSSGEKIALIKNTGEFVREWSASYLFELLGAKGENVYVRDILYSSIDNFEDQILFFKYDDLNPDIALVNQLNEEPAVDENWKYFSKEEKFVICNPKGGLSYLEETGENSYVIDSLDKDGMSFKVEDVYFCGKGKLWASSNSGLYKIHITPSKFQSFLHKEAPNHYSMRSIVAVGDSLYCNTYSGNIIYDLRKKEIVKKNPWDDTNEGLSSLKGSNGFIYSAGSGTALLQICEKTKEENYFYYSLKDYARVEDFPRDHWTIFEDQKNKIWLGTNQGLSFLNKEKGVLEPFVQYNQFLQLSETLVYEIIETDSIFWIAAHNGLYKMERDKGIISWFHSGAPIPDSNYLPADVIFDIHEDEDGLLWLTTLGSGLIRFNPKDLTYKQITVKEGLPHNVTNDILEDDFNNLWVSTNKGIMCINRQDGKIINFDKSDGLYLDEFNKKASAKLEDGRLVFGGLKGIVVFYPEDLLKETEKEEESRNLRITQFIIGDEIKRTIDFNQPIELNTPNTAITFNLRLIEFSNDEPAFYEWKWKGEEFSSLPSHQLFLARIPRGESKLVFRAKSAKGIPAFNELEISFSVPPLFSLVQILLGLCVGLGIFSFFFYKKKKKNVEQEALPKNEIGLAIEDEKELKVAEKEQPETKPIVLNTTNTRWLEKLTKTVSGCTNIGQFSVEDMAREMNLSSRQLNRKVKQLTGITPNQFLRNIKLEKAKALLESGTVSTVAEVSFVVGFEKPDYFSRLFKEKYGKRPVTYFDRNKR
ncbi:MAG: ligand-binding sensor domain-containing protein/AraC-like DNA-binding protein [Saprospiraceae bacterium]|jgi:ligand-binding sensor domain-containing protein/AraC-like DNA-binding protein